MNANWICFVAALAAVSGCGGAGAADREEGTSSARSDASEGRPVSAPPVPSLSESARKELYAESIAAYDDLDGRLARELALYPTEAAAFRGILGASHRDVLPNLGEARRTARALRGESPPVLSAPGAASPVETQRRLRALLGEERYARYRWLLRNQGELYR